MHTPGKQVFHLPKMALAEAVLAEWQAQRKYVSSKMPLTTLAYTAIDRIEGQQALIVEVLMSYVDTDALSYRASSFEPLWKQQVQQWDPLLEWMRERFGVTWASTRGVMPLEQPPELHEAVRSYLSALTSWQLAAGCVLASGFSSLALAIAVLERHADGDKAFRLSRLEEDSQAERWGVDYEAADRAERLKWEMIAAGQFLKLLDVH